MKKILSIILVLATLCGLCAIPSSTASLPSISLGTRINIKSQTGLGLGNDAGHGNHQTRTVHTSHGDYAAYVTKDFTNEKGQSMTQWTLFKIDASTGKATAIYTDVKYYDSSQVSLIVDKNENVWAITSTSDSLRNTTAEAIDARAYRLDAKTGEVTSYCSIISGGARDGYGYSVCFYDKYKNRIVVMHAGGDYVEGSTTGASFNWTIFDVNTCKWQVRVRSAKLDSRHCYMYGYMDEKGGLMLIAQRDIKASSLGYPEIGSNDGLTSADYQYMSNNGITRWAANYCWDQLDLFYFPDLTGNKYVQYSVCEADYSQVSGTQQERYTLAKRLSNYYSAVQNNNGGDFLLTETKDGRKLLHITYNKALIQAAMDRSKGSESKWYHQVWDVTDGTNAVKLYNGVLVDELAGEAGYCFRLYEDTKGNVNIVSCHNGSVTVYRTEYNGKGGYNYHKVGSSVSISGGGNLISISSQRGGSITDDKINVLYTSSGTYMFNQITIAPAEYEPIPCRHNNTLTSSVAPTCTTEGTELYTCTYCNERSTVSLPATDHTTAPLSAEPPTCTEDGFEKWYCTSQCGYTQTFVLPATGHSFNDGYCTECNAADPDFKPSFLPGDVNGDGTVNAKDINIAKRFLSGSTSPSEAQRLAADMDNDGNFNAKDANLLTRKVSGS